MALSLTIPGGMTLKESTFNALAPDGNPLHFRDRTFTYVDPITQDDTGLQAREVISSLAVLHGWPLTGIFFSTAGDQALPHMAVHVDDFPSQSGNPNQRADKLQTELLAAMEFLYKNERFDPDIGQTVEESQFFPQIHVYNYPALLARNGPVVGDYLVAVFRDQAPGNWWQGK